MAVVLLVSVLAGFAAVTAHGAHRRGNRMPLSLLAGLVFPMTWAAWYLRDVPVRHAG
jgi:hypothetical protein